MAKASNRYLQFTWHFSFMALLILIVLIRTNSVRQIWEFVEEKNGNKVFIALPLTG